MGNVEVTTDEVLHQIQQIYVIDEQHYLLQIMGDEIHMIGHVNE